MSIDILEEYSRGVNDYWSGKLPEGWDAPDANDNPYLAGWNHAAEQENGIKFFAEEYED